MMTHTDGNMKGSASFLKTQGMDTSSQPVDLPSVRMHSLDLLRTIAMLNVVLIHAAMSFAVKSPAGWAALDRSRSYLFDLFIFATVGFTVQMFFVITGLLAAPLWAKRGLAGFAWNRFRRIVIPFIISLLILVPIMQVVGLFGSMRKGTPGVAQTYFWITVVDFFTSSKFFQGYTLGHLWFLWYLILLYITLLVVIPFTRYLPGSRHVDRWFTGLLGSPARPLLLAIPTLALMYPMSWMIDTPVGIIPEVHILGYYGFFLGVGIMLSRQPQFFAARTNTWRWYLGIASVVVLPTTVGLIIKATASGQWRDSYYYSMAVACYALYTWLMIFGLLELCRNVASKPAAIIQYLSEASFWVYLIHFPIVLVLQILIKDVNVPALLKFFFVCSISALVILGSYEALVRRTFVGAILNGRQFSNVYVQQITPGDA